MCIGINNRCSRTRDIVILCKVSALTCLIKETGLVHVDEIIDRINNEHSICEVTHWFVDCHFEALSLHFGRLIFLEPEVTTF